MENENVNTSPQALQTPDVGGEVVAAQPVNDTQAGALSSPPALEHGAPPPLNGQMDAGLIGKDDKETIERLSAALSDLRMQRQASEPPKDLNEYADFSQVELADNIKEFVGDFVDDPVFKAAAQAAQKHGVSKAALQEIVTGVYMAGAENGLLEPPVDVEAERLALLPPGYENRPLAQQDSAINARLQANVDYLSLLVKNGRLDNDTAEHVAGMLMDTARGNKFLEFVRMQVSGGQLAQPFAQAGAYSGGVNSQAALRDELARVQAKKGTMEYDPSEHEAIMARYRNLYGD